MRSSSSLSDVSLFGKLSEGIGLASMHLRARHAVDLAGLDACFREYDETLTRNGRGPLLESNVLEIGYGARPFRLVWLHNLGVQVSGVDLDLPLLRFSLNSLVHLVRQNGPERALKSAIRYFISDVHQWRQIAKEIRSRGRSFTIPDDRLSVLDAASEKFWQRAGSFDFVYSEDVFEHIPKNDLRELVRRMACALFPNGLALIRPMVFTGICGGHHLEWYPHKLGQRMARRTEPWEHLRRKRFPANTYLNQLSRKDYIELFAEHFWILEDTAMKPRLGEQFMNERVSAELPEYDDYELFSNSVRFVLEPKRQMAH
jgi:Methyltransferase domain